MNTKIKIRFKTAKFLAEVKIKTILDCYRKHSQQKKVIGYEKKSNLQILIICHCRQCYCFGLQVFVSQCSVGICRYH